MSFYRRHTGPETAAPASGDAAAIKSPPPPRFSRRNFPEPLSHLRREVRERLTSSTHLPRRWLLPAVVIAIIALGSLLTAGPEPAQAQSADTVAPTLVSASAGAKSGRPYVRINPRLTFSENLDANSVPSSGAFTVVSRLRDRTWTHTGDASTAVVISGKTVTLTVDSSIFAAAALTVTYTKPSSGSKLRDPAGNEVESFTLSPRSRTSREVECHWDTGTWYVTNTYSSTRRDGHISDIPCDMAKPAVLTGRIPFVWFYNNVNIAPPVNQPIESVIYTAPRHPDHRAVLGTDGNCYREERVSGQWRRSVPYGSSVSEDCRKASWNAYNRAFRPTMVHRPTMINPDGGTFPDGPAPVAVTLNSAVVNETALALTFSENMDTASKPASSAFTVTVNNAQRNVASDGVAISGTNVTLTLASAVAASDTVKVRYHEPSTNPLQSRIPDLSITNPRQSQGFNSVAVETFADQAVVNRTPGTMFSATLTVTEPMAGSGFFGCGDSNQCGFTFTHLGSSYQVTAIWASADMLAFSLDGAIPQDLTLHLDDRPFRLSDATLYNFNRTARWTNPGLTWTTGQRVSVSLTWKTPLLESAAVDGTALTLTFSENMDTASKPASSAFTVTVNNAQRNVASDGVAISGTNVTLTLASAVAYGETVKVRYTKPSANPLQGAAGNDVVTFTDRTVSNNTAYIWSTTLTTGSSGESGNGCRTESSTLCSTALTDDDFTVGGTDYQVTIVATGIVSGVGGFLDLGLDKEIPTDWTLYVDSHDGLAVSTATRSNGNKTARWTNPGFGFGPNQTVSLSLKVPAGASSGAGGASGLIAPDEEQVPDVSVTGVSVVSDPGADKTYGIGDTIQVQVTFNQLVVDVDTSGGTPRLKIDMDPAEWGEKWASYASGSGSANLIFTHTVVEPNVSTQGIAVLADTLELNGGTIRSDGEDAGLAHTGLAHDANHKVDWEASPDSGSSDSGSEEDGASGGSGPEEEQVPDVSVTGVSVVSDPGADKTYGNGDTIQVQVTFNQLVVDVDTSGGTPRLKIDMDPAEWGEKWASYASGSGSANLIFTHTVVEPNVSTQGIAVLADTLELNGGTIRSDGEDAGLAHTGLAHDANHKVDWEHSESEPAANSAATGAPAITGTAQVGETLTADTSGIADADGLTGASFSYQWLAGGSDISGATGSTYTPAGADLGKAVRVRVSFTDDAGHAETLTSAATSAVAAADPPAVTALAITSDPGSDDTYRNGDVITVSVTFDEAVDVTGSPRLKIDMDPAEWGEKWASYQGGSGAKTLTFTHTVVEPNLSTQGIAVLANSLELNGGTIQSKATDTVASLGHAGLGHDSGHKVDWRTPAPTVVSVAVTSDPGGDDTYALGDVITISVTFSEAVDVDASGGTPRLKIDMDPAEWGTKLAAYHSGSGTKTLAFTHTVVEPNISTQGIAVLGNSLALNGGTIKSSATQTNADLSHTNLAHNPKHKVDWQLSDAGGPGS